MQSPLSLRNWIIFILVTVFVAALTAFIVVRVLTQAASQPDMAVVNAPAVPTAAPAMPMQPAPVDATAAVPDANTTPQSVLMPAATDANAVVTQPTADPNAAQPAAPADNAAAAAPITTTEATTATESASPAKVRISTVVFPGQRTREAVVIVNEGEQVDLSGWTLSNPRGKVYTFGTVMLLKENFINLHTTTGVDIPTDLFWNQEEAVWQAGDTATLKRGNEVMATFEVK
jgi:hypothetical protein